MVKNSIILDSSVWVSFYMHHDANHAKAKTLFKKMEQNKNIVIAPHSVIHEVATVLAYKHSLEQAKEFITFMQAGLGVHITEDPIQVEMKTYKKQFSKISFTDIAVIAIALQEKAELKTFNAQQKRVYKKMLRARN